MSTKLVDRRAFVDVPSGEMESTVESSLTNSQVNKTELAQSGDNESADSTLPSTLPRVRKHGARLRDALPWILERVRSGIPINHACEAAGFSKQSLYKHFNAFPGDREALMEAKADGELLLVETIQAEAVRNANFGLLVLERRRPDEWARPNPAQTNVAVRVDNHFKPLDQMSREELEAEALQLAKGSDDDSDPA